VSGWRGFDVEESPRERTTDAINTAVVKTALTCGSAACIYTVHRNTHVEEHSRTLRNAHVEEHQRIPRNRNSQDGEYPEKSGTNKSTQEHSLRNAHRSRNAQER